MLWLLTLCSLWVTREMIINIMLVVGDEGDDLPDGFVCSLKTDVQYRALIYAFMDLY